MAHLSLFQLNSLIKEQLEDNLQTSYWVIAEISGMQVNQKGHCYMELVEKEGNYVQAKLRANIWSYTYRTISSQFRQVTGSNLSIGLKGLFNVKVNFHEVYGLSLTVNDIDPNFTLGERSRQREETIQKLDQEGLLKLNKELVLPVVPQRIAIISSATAAGYEDFVNQLNRNERGIDFSQTLFHSVMQGNEAPTSIAQSIAQVKERVSEFDVLVVIRGGGSKTDLDAFDDYNMCKALANASIPVITGIGHERDESVADLVAHIPLKTPTAVAEFLIAGAAQFEDRLNEFLYALEKSFNQRYDLAHQNIDLLGSRLERAASSQLNQAQFHLEKLKNQLLQHSSSMIHKQQLALNALEHKIKLVNPQTAFEQGYTLTLKEGKKVNPENINVDDLIETRGKNIQLKSKITEVSNG